MRKRKQYRFATVNGKTYRQHRLIVEQLIGRQLKRDEAVHHIDGNGRNNALGNLQIVNEQEHNVLTGRCYRPGAKLLIEDIPIIRKMLSDKIQEWLIAFIYKVHKRTIADISCGKSWHWV